MSLTTDKRSGAALFCYRCGCDPVVNSLLFDRIFFCLPQAVWREKTDWQEAGGSLDDSVHLFYNGPRGDFF